MGFLSNKISKEQLQAGDHIYTWTFCYIYAHHGIYIGDNNVIHFAAQGGSEIDATTFSNKLLSSFVPQDSFRCSGCGLNAENNNGVRLSDLDSFLNGGKLYRFEYGVDKMTFFVHLRGGTCTLVQADPVEDVLHRAKVLCETGFGRYDLLQNNCEDFAIYCKTGLVVMNQIQGGRSGQVNALRSLLRSGDSVDYVRSKYQVDLSNRKDVVKVAVEDLPVKLGWSSSSTFV
ncbi:hypothetical protein KP509_09G101000 [Ceratopteris richardii]|uniref:LRAT domain-containing protein n=1 Tax=Ceratopteris richardii TaxID=49495 RepID=A0A8T2UA34_CERRI|nr:hypothetical protein KP509_09G101000 [Ceratopteris richardii]